jgi:hypothetical protein
LVHQEEEANQSRVINEAYLIHLETHDREVLRKKNRAK